MAIEKGMVVTLPQGLTEGLASFVIDCDSSVIGSQGHQMAKKVVADTIAVILSGAGSEVAQPLLDYTEKSGTGNVLIPGTNAKASAPVAALVSGTFGAALDFDDVLSMMPGHPAAVIIPALISEAYQKTCRGGEFLDAYVVGLELGAKLSQGIGLAHYAKGFHATGTVALFCGVGAVARLQKDIKKSQVQMAISLAASLAGGLHSNFGTMTKPFHSGWAAQSSVVSVDLVRSGFTASLSALEDKGGYFSAYGTEESDPEKVLPLLGKPWSIVDPGIALKKFPTCIATHRAIDAVQQIKKRIKDPLSQIKKIVCRIAPGAGLVLRFDRPKTGLESKFSMQHALAAAVYFDTLSISSFSDEAITIPDIAGLYEKVEVVEDPTCTEGDPDWEKKSSATRGFVVVDAHLSDGSIESCRVDLPPGNPKRALSWDDLHSKFIDCAETCEIDKSIADEVFSKLTELEKIQDVSALLSKLCPKEKA